MMNLRTLLLLAAALLLPSSPLCAQQEEPEQKEEPAQSTPTSHREAALMLIDLLRPSALSSVFKTLSLSQLLRITWRLRI